jgi:hypothetical protein
MYLITLDCKTKKLLAKKYNVTGRKLIFQKIENRITQTFSFLLLHIAFFFANPSSLINEKKRVLSLLT